VKGHTRKRGTWEYIIDAGTKPAQRCLECHKRFWVQRDRGRLEACPGCGGELRLGRERYKVTKTGFPTKSAAEDALATAITEIRRGTHVSPNKLTLGDFLTKKWLPRVKKDCRPTTYGLYETLARRHLADREREPNLGVVPLQELTADLIMQLDDDLAIGGRVRNGKGGLGIHSRRHIYFVLRRALNDAVAWGYLSHNPALAVRPPARRRNEKQTWTAEEVERFQDATRDDRLGVLWMLCLDTGVRREEVLGLRWRDVDLEGARLTVRRTRVMVGGKTIEQPLTKTASSRREIALAAETVAGLKTHAARQGREAGQWRESWVDSGFVFTAENGEPLNPTFVTRELGRVAKRLDLPHLGPHGLRHTMATLALEAGVHPLLVKERLGHSSVSVTLDEYTHPAQPAHEQAAAQIAAIMRRP
jgi:integrase